MIRIPVGKEYEQRYWSLVIRHWVTEKYEQKVDGPVESRNLKPPPKAQLAVNKIGNHNVVLVKRGERAARNKRRPVNVNSASYSRS